MEELAKIIDENKKIKEIRGTSWIFAKNPKIMEKYGFTDMGQISEEEREKYFDNDPRPINRAFISREDFLKRYLKEKSNE